MGVTVCGTFWKYAKPPILINSITLKMSDNTTNAIAPIFKSFTYLKLNNVPTNIKPKATAIKTDMEYIVICNGLVSKYRRLPIPKIKEIKFEINFIPKAIGNNHFLKRYSFFKVNKNTRTKTGVTNGIKARIRELRAWRKFNKKRDLLKLMVRIKHKV